MKKADILNYFFCKHKCHLTRDQLCACAKPIGVSFGRSEGWGQIVHIEDKEEPETFKTNMFSELRGNSVMALILACYSLGHKRLQTSYYRNNSLHGLCMLGWRWKRFPYQKKKEIRFSDIFALYLKCSSFYEQKKEEAAMIANMLLIPCS